MNINWFCHWRCQTEVNYDQCFSECIKEVSTWDEKKRNLAEILAKGFEIVVPQVMRKLIEIRDDIERKFVDDHVEARAKLSDRTWMFHVRLPPVEGKCRRLKDIIVEKDGLQFYVQTKLCYENNDYWVKFTYSVFSRS